MANDFSSTGLPKNDLLGTNLYEILGVEPDVKPVELKRVFRTKLRDKKTMENQRKLYEYKRKKAEKERENMKNTAIQSRERERKVTAVMEDGRVLENAGLIIIKARYGIIYWNDHKVSFVFFLEKEGTPFFLKKKKIYMYMFYKKKKKKNDDRTGDDKMMMEKENTNNDENGSYEIDVTDAVQCL
ncbi:hypothetical protein RFI_12533, partial [Reticulomyxa filosa]